MGDVFSFMFFVVLIVLLMPWKPRTTQMILGIIMIQGLGMASPHTATQHPGRFRRRLLLQRVVWKPQGSWGNGGWSNGPLPCCKHDMNECVVYLLVIKHSSGKSLWIQILRGKSLINGPFYIAMFDYRRVNYLLKMLLHGSPDERCLAKIHVFICNMVK